MSTNTNPATPSLAHQRQAEAVTICRDVFAGPLHMRDQGRRYLPQFPGEDTAAYSDRLNTSVCYDAYARTVNGLTGMVFRTVPQLADDLPPQIHEAWENIDLAGTHGSVFCQQRHTDGEVDGHFVIFVDMQRAKNDVKTLADERNAKLRPYWIGIKKQDVLAADHELVNGAWTLTHFRYRETVTVKDGYDQKEVERVREYNLADGIVAFTVWQHNGADGMMEVDGGFMSIDEIPVSVAYLGKKVGPFESDPPHLALALENIKHYQLTSDNDNVLHLCSVPVFVRIGYEHDDDDAQIIGPTVGIDLPLEGDAKYVEPEGNGLQAMERRIDKSEFRMSILGLSMLMSESRQAETATSKRINKAESDSALSSHARASQDAFEDAIRLTAKWLGLDLPNRTPETRWVSVNRDFEQLHLDAQMITAIANMVASNQLSHETLWDTLSRGGILDSAFDPTLERERIESGAGENLEALSRILKAPTPDELAA